MKISGINNHNNLISMYSSCNTSIHGEKTQSCFQENNGKKINMQFSKKNVQNVQIMKT